MNMLPAVAELCQEFRGCVTRPTFEVLRRLLLAWIVTPGRRTITRLLRSPLASGGTEGEHHARFHRFFTTARWSTDAIGGVLLRLLRPYLQTTVTLLVDDTLCRRSGPRILGAGMHYDPLRSTYSESGSRRATVRFAFGLSFVVLGVWVPMACLRSGGLCVPFLVRLYRSKKTCPAKRYRKRTDLAAELLEVAQPWLSDRRVVVVADREYACMTVLQRLPAAFDMVGRLPMDAALHTVDVPINRVGRRRLWGTRTPGPGALIADDQPWKKGTFALYGKQVTMLTKTRFATWRRVARISLCESSSRAIRKADGAMQRSSQRGCQVTLPRF